MFLSNYRGDIDIDSNDKESEELHTLRTRDLLAAHAPLAHEVQSVRDALASKTGEKQAISDPACASQG